MDFPVEDITATGAVTDGLEDEVRLVAVVGVEAAVLDVDALDDLAVRLVLGGVDAERVCIINSESISNNSYITYMHIKKEGLDCHLQVILFVRECLELPYVVY